MFGSFRFKKPTRKYYRSYFFLLLATAKDWRREMTANKITATHAGWSIRFRIRVAPHRPDAAEFGHLRSEPVILRDAIVQAAKMQFDSCGTN